MRFSLAKCITPVAITTRKRGRTVVICKLVEVEPGEVVIAVTWRQQRGTADVVSLPTRLLAWAHNVGVRTVFLRNDREGWLRRISVAELLAAGWHREDNETYWKVKAMAPVPWRWWPFAERTIDLDELLELVPPEDGR